MCEEPIDAILLTLLVLVWGLCVQEFCHVASDPVVHLTCRVQVVDPYLAISLGHIFKGEAV